MTGYRVEISESKKRKTACAYLRDGALVVELPERWPRAFKDEVTQKLIRRVLQKEAKQYALMQQARQNTRKITLRTEAELGEYVARINAETFRVPLGPVKIGQARYTRLAQVNLKSRVMTVSKYCLHDVPESALRYLIVHELAHYLEAGHTKRFWNLVGRHVPDYKEQSRLMKAFHRDAVSQGEEPSVSPAPARPLPNLPSETSPHPLPHNKIPSAPPKPTRQLPLFPAEPV